MNINNIQQVKFLKKGEDISYPNLEETNIEFDDLIELISDIEDIKGGFGKLIHGEGYNGIDYLGNRVTYNSYVCYEKLNNGDWKIYKYNFNEEYIPFNAFIIKRKRDEIIDEIIN